MDETRLLAKFDSLVQSGLVLYDDNQQTIEHVDGDLKFHFILTSALATKPTLHSTQPQAPPQHLYHPGSDITTTGYELGTLGAQHLLAASKFCYARPLVVLLTFDGHRRQYEALDSHDLTAAVTCLNAMHSEQDYAVFYNCGQDGGCSRLHKHMQLMPMPKDSFAAFLDRAEGEEPAPGVPFAWFWRRFGAEGLTPAIAVSVYKVLLKAADKVGRGLGQSASSMPVGAACPHNVIITKRWMVVIPRRRAGLSKATGANAMGMLGYIAVANRSEIDTWGRLGLKDTLGQLGVPNES